MAVFPLNQIKLMGYLIEKVSFRSGVKQPPILSERTYRPRRCLGMTKGMAGIIVGTNCSVIWARKEKIDIPANATYYKTVPRVK